jgi:hypothetical protein
MLGDLNRRYEEVMGLYAQWLGLEELMPAAAKEVKDAYARDDFAMGKRVREAQAFVIALPAAPRADVGQQDEAPRRLFREQAGLRPETLTMSALPMEVTAWTVKYKAYYQASNMDLLGLAEQQAYFFNRMYVDLETRMKGTVTDSTSLDECSKELRRVFLEIHPRFQRRLAWFQLEKKKDMTVSQFYYNLRRLGNEAELD